MERNEEEDREKKNPPGPEEKIPYPKSIFFIFSNEFCERFSYYGMRTVLALYLQTYLGYSEDLSTVVYHIFVMLCYFTPLIGGIIADSWLGKYKTIFYVSILYAIGNIILSVGAVPEAGIPTVWFSLLGLFLIGTGTGGIKPCVSSFGGDQFIVPQQAKQLESFFSIFYFSINAGSVLSCFFTPMLRQVKCFGQNDCYSLAFGIPAVLMIVSIVFFVAGRSRYIIKKPDGKNVVLQVFSCVGHALWRKIKSKEKKDHWLDYSNDKYSLKQIEDTKLFMKIVYLFTPTIIFWALYEQQGSRWTFQASHMDGRFGSWVLQPDQMQTLNAVLVLVFIPIFDKLVYPCCAKLRIIRTPLQKLTWGGFLGALSFVIAGIVQMYMQPCYPVFPAAGEAQLRLYNDLNSNISITGSTFKNTTIDSFSQYQNLNIPVPGSSRLIPFSLSAPGMDTFDSSLLVNNKKAASYLITSSNKTFDIFPLEVNGYDEIDKLDSGNPKLKLIYGSIGSEISVKLSSSDENHNYALDPSVHQTVWNDTTTTGLYSVLVTDGSKSFNLDKVNLEPGGVYVMMLIKNNQKWSYKLFIVTPPNNINMLWQVPQYFVITFAEILFSITGMEFAFTQSPDSMKSVVSSLWLITDAFGNAIVLIIASLQIFDNQAYEFFLFAGLMAAVMLIFMYMAYKWKYVNTEQTVPAIQSIDQPDS